MNNLRTCFQKEIYYLSILYEIYYPSILYEKIFEGLKKGPKYRIMLQDPRQ